MERPFGVEAPRPPRRTQRTDAGKGDSSGRSPRVQALSDQSSPSHWISQSFFTQAGRYAPVALVGRRSDQLPQWRSTPNFFDGSLGRHALGGAGCNGPVKHGKNLSILKGMILLDSAEYDIARNLEEANDGPLAPPGL
jgi:hypothetical protein